MYKPALKLLAKTATPTAMPTIGGSPAALPTPASASSSLPFSPQSALNKPVGLFAPIGVATVASPGAGPSAINIANATAAAAAVASSFTNAAQVEQERKAAAAAKKNAEEKKKSNLELFKEELKRYKLEKI